MRTDGAVAPPKQRVNKLGELKKIKRYNMSIKPFINNKLMELTNLNVERTHLAQ